MIRTKGEAGTGNIVEAVRHMRAVMEGIKQVVETPAAGLKELATTFRVPVELVKEVKKLGKLPVVNFAAGGVATPADAALMMQLGAEGVFVGSGIFKSSNPSVRAKAIVKATTHYQDAAIIAEVSKNLGDAMPGLDIKQIPEEELLAKRGW
jgi:pyridoxal 5'-phosphate synthase pdxS subunit